MCFRYVGWCKYMFKVFKKLGKLLVLGSELILVSIVLFSMIFCLIGMLNNVVHFHTDPTMFKFLLTTIFFVISFILVATTYIIMRKENVKQTKIKFAQIFDFLGEEISIPDSKTLTFTYLNKSLLNNTQYEMNELVGQYITNTNPDCEIKRMQEFIKPLVTEEVDILKYETIRSRKDGSKYPIQTMLKYFSDTNTLIAFSQDISKEKEIESIKSQFISIINHELRTPLTSVTGALHIILNDLVGEVPVSMKQMIEVANNNANRLLELLNEILDADKFQAKACKINFANNDVQKD